ncbi:uncharacterized protein LOC119996235 [Tripterygium wilfordii]|uniref:uncharacterized protein LOC119996235 n=1 Tax=Tripterygium wilfordii TaxID=458696 RepID=UPI0018F841C9|nr:uncharacterized protein LOC119996235 [Tripterygium wilfordii]
MENLPLSKKFYLHLDGTSTYIPDVDLPSRIANLPVPSALTQPPIQQVESASRRRVELSDPPLKFLALSPELLDVVFRIGIPTVKSIPLLCRLPFADALRGALNLIISSPSNVENWVKLLLLPVTVLYRFSPVSSQEHSARKRNSLQQLMILRALEVWNSGTVGIQQLLARVLEHEPLSPLSTSTDINVQRAKCKVKDGQYAVAIRMLSSCGVASSSAATWQGLVEKHPQCECPTPSTFGNSAAPFEASMGAIEEAIKSFPKGTACGRDGLRAQHLIDAMRGAAAAIKDDLLHSIALVVNLWLAGRCPTELGPYVASAPLTPLLKSDGGIRPIAVGTIWHRLVSKLTVKGVIKDMVHYLRDHQFGVGIPEGAEAVIHAVNRIVQAEKDNTKLTMSLVDFSNAFNLVDRGVMFREVRLRCPALACWVEFCYGKAAKLYLGRNCIVSSTGIQQGDPFGPLLFSLVLHPLLHRIKEECGLAFMAFYLDDGTIIDDTFKVDKAIRFIQEVGPEYGLLLNINKTEVFWPSEDPRRSPEANLFSRGIARPMCGVKVLGGPVSSDAVFCVQMLHMRVSKALVAMDLLDQLKDPQMELLLLRACVGMSKMVFALHTCPP